MNSKKWTVIVIAIILIVATSLSSIGVPSLEEENYSRNFLAMLGRPVEVIEEEGSSAERILKINVEGAIDGSEAAGGYSQETTLYAVEQIKEDPTIQAVLLSLDTPGGTVYEIREVYDLMMDVKEETGIPVYASMGSMAASGGVYYAMMADEVYASPESWTGSIGVILSTLNMEGLLDKVGLEERVFKTGEFKDIGSATREVTEEEEEIFQSLIDDSFDRFIQVVMDGRDMDEKAVREIADGRIFTAEQAQEINLIDDILYEGEVIEKMKADLGLDNPQIFYFEKQSSSFTSFLPFMDAAFINRLGQSELEKTMDEIEELSEIQVEYRWEGY